MLPLSRGSVTGAQEDGQDSEEVVTFMLDIRVGAQRVGQHLWAAHRNCIFHFPSFVCLRLLQLWNGVEDIDEEVQQKTSRHSLSGELGEEEKLDGRIETKFHVFSELGSALTLRPLFNLVNNGL